MQSICANLESCTEAWGSLVSRLSNTVDKISNVSPERQWPGRERYEWHPDNLNGKSSLSCTTVFQQKRSKAAKSRDGMEEVRGRIYTAWHWVRHKVRHDWSRANNHVACAAPNVVRAYLQVGARPFPALLCLVGKFISVTQCFCSLGPARMWTGQWRVFSTGGRTAFCNCQRRALSASFNVLDFVHSTTVRRVQYIQFWQYLYNFFAGFKVRCTRFNLIV